jgi:polyketide biosynthesis acyl carrier protein
MGGNMIQGTEIERNTIAGVVREAISSILPNLPPELISGQTGLIDYGADSVDRVEIILSILKRLGLNAPMSSFSNIPTIDGLVNHLCTIHPK